MSSPRSSKGLSGVLFACLFSLSTSPLMALTMICGERGASYRSISKSDGTLTVSVAHNDAVRWLAFSGGTEIEIDIGSGFAPASSFGSFDAPKTWVSIMLKVTSDTGQLGVSCTAGSGDDDSSITWGLSANSQTQATNTGIGVNSKGRFGVSSNIVSQDFIYVSTSNGASGQLLPAGWSAWGTLEGRFYSGGTQGVSVDFVGGIDNMIAPDLLVGVLAGYGRTMVTDGGVDETAASPMLGVYFGKNVDENLLIDGFLSFARPQYDTSGASFLASRVSAGLTVTGQFSRKGLLIEPFLFARGYSEQQPGYTTGLGALVAANDALSVAASLGVRVNFLNANFAGNLKPYASVAADYQRVFNTVGADDLVLAPRIAMGVTGELWQGQVSVDIDFGKSSSDTFDRGLKFGYEVSF
ncbi:MAG: hypothetical protein ACI8YI_002547 [Paracoccaceae bacterium]|jgi:hypothetical protein